MDALFLGLRHVALNVKNVRESVNFYSHCSGYARGVGTRSG